MERFKKFLKEDDSAAELEHYLNAMIGELEATLAKVKKGIRKDIDLDKNGEFTIPYNSYNKLAHRQ